MDLNPQTSPEYDGFLDGVPVTEITVDHRMKRGFMFADQHGFLGIMPVTNPSKGLLDRFNKGDRFIVKLQRSRDEEDPQVKLEPKLIFVCSPLVGNLPSDATEDEILRTIERNQEWAEMFCWYTAKQGHDPYAPHLLCTRFLDDTKPEDRELGIQIGLRMLRRCAEVWVFLREGDVPSRGMRREIALAESLGIPVRYIDPEVVAAAYAEAYGMGEANDGPIHICE